MFEQSKHQGNLTFQAEHKQFSLGAPVRYRSKDLEDVIAPGFGMSARPLAYLRPDIALRSPGNSGLKSGAGSLLGVYFANIARQSRAAYPALNDWHFQRFNGALRPNP